MEEGGKPRLQTWNSIETRGGSRGRGLSAVHGGGNGNHPYLMSFSYFPGGVLKMAVWHASPSSLRSLGFISITFSNPCHFTLVLLPIENERTLFDRSCIPVSF